MVKVGSVSNTWHHPHLATVSIQLTGRGTHVYKSKCFSLHSWARLTGSAPVKKTIHMYLCQHLQTLVYVVHSKYPPLQCWWSSGGLDDIEDDNPYHQQLCCLHQTVHGRKMREGERKGGRGFTKANGEGNTTLKGGNLESYDSNRIRNSFI